LKSYSHGLISLNDKPTLIKEKVSQLKRLSRHDLYDKGSPLMTCMRLNKSEIKVLLFHILKNTVDYVDANKTLSVLEIKDAVDELMNDEEIKTWKLEEVVVCLDKLKYEKFYERLKYAEIKEFFYNQIQDRSYIMDEVNDRRKKYELNQVDYDAYKKWQKENPPKKKQEQSDYNNFKAHYNTTQARCKGIAMKVMTGSRLNESDLEFYKKNKTTIELIRLSLNKKV
tara:strand:- start:336 stop:1013 length:678 start_codon:yes stop_codon:yes gene_type:complete